MIVFTKNGWDDYASWADDRYTLKRPNRLIEEGSRDPSAGIGKPERLSGDLAGYAELIKSTALSIPSRRGSGDRASPLPLLNAAPNCWLAFGMLTRHDECSWVAALSASMATMRDSTEPTTPTLRQVVLDCEDARVLAEFYRQLLGFHYRPGDEPPADETPDAQGQDWLVLCDATGTPRLAFQQVPHLPEPTWPEGPRPQMLHLDTTVPTVTNLHIQHQRALALGARLLLDRSDDEIEPLFVYADPAGHPFCIFVAPS